MAILQERKSTLAPSGRKPENVGGSLLLHYWVCQVNGLTYSDFAELTGESKANVSNHASGVSFPRENTLLKYAKALNVDVRDLFVATWPGREMKHTGTSRKGWGKIDKG